MRIVENKNVAESILKNIIAAGKHGWVIGGDELMEVSIMHGDNVIDICSAPIDELWETFEDWCNSEDNMYGIHSVPFILFVGEFNPGENIDCTKCLFCDEYNCHYCKNRVKVEEE